MIVLFAKGDSIAVLWNLRPTDPAGWVAWIVIGFVAGHAVTSIGENLVIPIVDATIGRLAKRLGSQVPNLLKRFKPDRVLFSELRSEPLFDTVIQYYNSRAGTTLSPDQTKSFLLVRNLAIGLLGEEKYTVYRFMFLSLLNLGVGTVLLISSLVASALWVTGQKLTISAGDGVCPLWIAGVVALVGAVLFLERRYRFHGITMSVPFSMAVGRMVKQDRPPEGEDKAASEGTRPSPT